MLGGHSGTHYDEVRFPVHGGKQTSSQLVPPGPPSIENNAHGIEKLLLKTKVKGSCIVK